MNNGKHIEAIQANKRSLGPLSQSPYQHKANRLQVGMYTQAHKTKFMFKNFHILHRTPKELIMMVIVNGKLIFRTKVVYSN